MIIKREKISKKNVTNPERKTNENIRKQTKKKRIPVTETRKRKKR